ncbi:MAG: hypothetical protein DRQ48_10555, partial [Gammaproteobacteria bacterium]
MYEDYEGSKYSGQLKECKEPPTAPESAPLTDRPTMNRWQFRADQVQVLHQQVQTELIISMLVAAIVATVFWNTAPYELLITWAVAVVVSVGGRSLFINNDNYEDSRKDIDVWGQQYITGATISGICWGALGIIAAIYGDLPRQIFVLVTVAGMSLTAYVSMQSSPRTIIAFVIPALLPVTALFFYQGDTLSLALGTLAIIFAAVMLFSSRATRNILSKSFSLGSHNTDLIKKLVLTRETAEGAKKYAEEVNVKLQEQMREREQAEERIRSSEQRMSAIFDSMQDTIYQTDIGGCVLWTTPSIKQLLGYEANEVINKDIKDFYVCASDHDDLKHSLDVNYGRLQHFEARLQHSD